MRSITTLDDRWIMIIIGLLFISVNLISARSDQHNGHDVNICTNHEQLRCPDGEVISVQEVTCGGQGRPCVTSLNLTVRDICHGQQTCSNVGLPDMFSSQCANQRTAVRFRFKCVPGKSANCRSNVCAKDSQGLICPPRSTIHIRKVTCSTGSTSCAWKSFNLLISLCEGSDECAASGLRTLLSPHCDVNDGAKKQVLVEYLCVPAQLIYRSCSSYRDRPISSDFGILGLPGVDARTTNTKKNKRCKWIIDPKSNQQPITVTVSLVQSRVTKNGCDPNFLRIQLMGCHSAEKKVLLRSFCDLKDGVVQLRSCGPIKVTSFARSKGDRSSQFIVSFQSFSDSDRESFLSSGLSRCTVPPPPIPSNPSVLILPTKTETTKKSSHTALHNADSDDPETAGIGQTGSFKITLKMLLLYIFLGALILILAAALITVLVRYHRISSSKHKYDSSENVVLWRRYQDTALDAFQHNGMVDHTSSFVTDRGQNSDQVVATVHHDPLPEQDDQDFRISCGSGFSSFLPPKRDSGLNDLLESFQTGNFGTHNNLQNVSDSDRKSRSVSRYDYYEIPGQSAPQDIYQALDVDDDLQFGGHYSNPNSLSRQPKTLAYTDDGEQHLMGSEDHQPLVLPDIRPKDEYHYTVNNDEYAVVNKSQKPSSKKGRQNSGANIHTPNTMDNSNGFVDFRPTSGPYGKNSVSNASHRKSRENRWRDEL